MNKLQTLFRSYYGVAACLGVFIPAYFFVSNNAPPLFSGITFITAGLALALLITGMQRADPATGNSFAIELLVLSFVLSIAYFLLLNYTTLRVSKDVRWQHGFGLRNWSLTHEAIELKKQSDCPVNTPRALLLCTGMKQDHITMLWKEWTVYFAGVSLILAFTLAVLTWTQGWLILARNYLFKQNIR